MNARPAVFAAVAVTLVALLIVLSSAVFTVDQTEQVLITQFGKVERLVTAPGLHLKTPFVQSVISFDKRLLDYDVPSEEVILGDQRRLNVDGFVRYRIVDPLKYYQAVGAQEDSIHARLNSVTSSTIRRVMGGEQLLDVLSSKRESIMAAIRDQAEREMDGFGVKVEDVRIRRADLPAENTQAILDRMKSERVRIAKQLRAEGAEAAARIRANAERDRTVLLAEAKASADNLRGEGEAKSIAIYADAFQRDQGFFQTWRTLQAYRDAFAGGGSRLVMTSDSDFLRLLRQAPSAGAPAGAAAPTSASVPPP